MIELAKSSMSPVARLLFSVPSSRLRTSPSTSITLSGLSLGKSSERVWFSGSSTTWVFPSRSRKSKKKTPPWSRKESIHPIKVAGDPALSLRS